MKNLDESSFEERLELYFEWAVTAWLLLKDEAGLIAALAAAKTFNTTDRQIIVTILDNLQTEWSKHDSENLFRETIKSLQDLKDIITAKDWTVEDALVDPEQGAGCAGYKVAAGRAQGQLQSAQVQGALGA